MSTQKFSNSATAAEVKTVSLNNEDVFASRLIYYVLLTCVCLCLYAPGQANLPFFDRDEPHFAQASRQMLSENNYWQVNFQYQPRHLKPPGIYWLQAAAVHLFTGVESQQTWPYRLPSLLGAWLAVLLTFEIGRRLSNKNTAALAAIILACSILLMVEAHLAVTDAMLLATVLVMQLGLAQIYCNEGSKPSPSAALLFWIGMAAGIFIKGITPLIGGLTILGLYITDRRRPWLKGIGWRWGLPLLVMLTLAWLIPFSKASGSNFLWDMIRGDILPKLSGGQQSHGMWPGYFLLIFTIAFWPGSLWAVPAAVWAWKNRFTPSIRFLLAWIIPNWLFFELVPTKLPEYVLPTFPAIALLIAIALHSSPFPSPSQQRVTPTLTLPLGGGGNWRRILRIIRIAQPAIWIIFSAVLAGGFIYLGGWGWGAGLLTLAGSAVLLFRYYSHPQRPQSGFGVFLCSCSFILIWQMVLPHLSSIWMTQRLSHSLAQLSPQLINQQNPAIAIGYQEPSLVFELGQREVLMRDMWDGIFLNSQATPQRLLLIAQDQMPCFRQIANDYQISWRSLGIVEGFQYNRGQRTVVHFILLLGAYHGNANSYQTGFLGSFIDFDRPLLFFCRSSSLHFFRSDRPASSMAQQNFRSN